METKQLILPISVVAEYLYCPRSCFYKIFEAEENDGGNVPIVDGRNRHEIVHKETDSAKRKSNISVFSHALGLSGKLDLLEIEDSKYIPVEYKRGRTRDFPTIKIQLCLYVLCIEEMYKTYINTGFIYFFEDNKRMAVELNFSLRDTAIKIIKEIREKIGKNSIREFPQIGSTLCDKCSYFQPCMPFLKD
jgi:CRISPR-associated exonuclease Cas4